MISTTITNLAELSFNNKNNAISLAHEYNRNIAHTKVNAKGYIKNIENGKFIVLEEVNKYGVKKYAVFNISLYNEGCKGMLIPMKLDSKGRIVNNQEFEPIDIDCCNTATLMYDVSSSTFKMKINDNDNAALFKSCEVANAYAEALNYTSTAEH